jgi:hypothetical protein
MEADERRPLLKRQLLQFAIFNLFIVAASGLLMRAIPLVNGFPLDFGNVLHSHSHFAFGGWVLPILVWMIMEYFPEVERRISFVHWRNIIMLILFSAYGMFITFPFQGYAPASIFFSTVSVLAGVYLAIAIWKACRGFQQKISLLLLQAGLFYLVISSIGPFATGPLAAMGKAGSPIYYNAIYFYLHFQYNGFFSFVIFAVLAAILERKGLMKHGNQFFVLSNFACVLTFFLSVLWNRPHNIFYILGGTGAIFQLVAISYLLKDFTRMQMSKTLVHVVLKLAMLALVIKVGLQVFSALPVVADMAFATRNFIVAYLHLVLLGFITFFSFAYILLKYKHLTGGSFRLPIVMFICTFFLTQLLLVVQAILGLWMIQIPHFSYPIFVFSIPFPISALLLFVRLSNDFQKKSLLHVA